MEERKEVREPTLPTLREQVVKLGKEDGDKGPFLGWDNLRGDVANMGQKNSVNRSDPMNTMLITQTLAAATPSPVFTLEHDLDG